MLNGKIEKNVPFPPQHGILSTFHKELIDYLNKLEIGDSVLFQSERTEVYKLDARIRIPLKIYGITTGKEFMMKLYVEKGVVRIWRLK